MVKDNDMKITAHANGSYSLILRKDEFEALGSGYRLVLEFSYGFDYVNDNVVIDFFGVHSLNLALDACRYYKLTIDQ